VTVVYEALTAWEQHDRELSEEHAKAIASTGVVTVTPAEGVGTWTLRADSRVGVLVGDGWQIGIRPRLKIPRLMFLLGYSLRSEGWKETQAIFETAEHIEDAIAAAFSVHTERALRPGVLHGYIAVDASEPTLRGRVRFADQFARRPGLPIPVEITYDDFTPNVLENRMLLTAAELLLRLPRIPPQARRRLLWARVALEGVERLAVTRVDAPEITRLNARYGSALVLAELIIRRFSLGAEHGAVAATSFVFDMNEVFESFLTTRLSKAFRRHGGWVSRQRPTPLAVGLGMNTDITWHGRESVRAVIDAKYKSLVDAKTMPNADAYQMLAYCVSLNLRRGHLIYAKESGQAERVYSVIRHGYEIDVRAVDVELAPEALLAQVDAIADSIAHDWRESEAVAA
jgi:5-methylcytosine-specific restriction enzyme subunit McrC